MGVCNFNSKKFLFVDIPGTYSIMSNSEEEEIARDFICFSKPNATVVILDATCLERNLNLLYQIMEITPNVIACVNLLDEAEKKGIHIDLNLLSLKLGVPVVGTIARKPKTLKKLLQTIEDVVCGKIIISPKLVEYDLNTEETITNISRKIDNLISDDDKYLKRWISLKLIDGDEKIVESINKNFFKSSKNSAQPKTIIKNINSKNNLKDSDNNFKDNVVSSILYRAEAVQKSVCSYSNLSYNSKDRKIDKILTSKYFGIPIMLGFLAIIFWITIVGANYPSALLSNMFSLFETKITNFLNTINFPSWLTSVLIDGIYTTLTWVISVMLPPMAIFFPIFTLLEDLGFLPRIAFNLDKYFKKACSSGKQALTMCMGFGCNAAGVVGCRIIDSPREKLISILTNSFVPCNGRFPFLITIAMVFIGGFASGFTSSLLATLAVLLVVLLGIFLTLLTSKILSKTILKGIPSSFMLELPPYRKPQIGKVLVRSIFDRTLFVLGRAVAVAAPSGLIIWLFANIHICDISLLSYVANFFDPFAKLMGLDGYILTAFILGLPANEIVLPIILMSYMQSGVLVNLEDTFSIGQILIQNGWTLLTAINVMFFTLLHFPCSTTLMTIKKETRKWKWSFIAFALPTVFGIIICMFNNLIWNIIF